MDKVRNKGEVQRGMDRKWDRRAVILLAGLFIFRTAYLLVAPFDLAPDEAYYWDWSRQLDWGYLSKPPMVAWMIRGSTQILGSTPFGVRFPTIILGTLGLCCIYGLGRRLYGSGAGFWAAALSAATPGNCGLNLIMTIDAPLMFFWSFSLYAFWRAVEEKERGFGWWFLSTIGVAMGLLSKQTMFGFPVLAMVFLWMSGEDRFLLKRLRPYLWILCSVLLLLPVVWWNAQHDWVTLRHTAHHFEPSRGIWGLSPSHLFKLLGTQMGLLSPLTWTLMAAVGVAGLRRLTRLERRELFLVIFGALPLAGIFLLSLRQNVHANWPGPVYAALSVLLAAWGTNALPGGYRAFRRQGLFKPAVALGAALGVAAYLLPPVLAATHLAGSRLDPTVRVRGWRELGRSVGSLKDTILTADRGFVASPRRQITSELAFYIPGQPRVYRWPPYKGTSLTQYEVWPPPRPGGQDALIVIEARRDLPENTQHCFREVVFVKEVRVSMGPGKDKAYRIYKGVGLRSWPEIH